MDIRLSSRTAGDGSALDPVAEHARQRLQFRLRQRSDRVAHISVRLGDTGSRRDHRDHRDTYCVMQVQLRDAPSASVVGIGEDAYDTIDRATDRVGQLVAELLKAADGLRSDPARNKEVAA